MTETATGHGTPRATPPGEEWFRRFHEARAGAPRLICFPHAGGSASAYFALSAALAPDVEVLAVQYPGRQDRRHEPCLDSIPALTEALTGVLPARLDRPFALFGHSMGASVAFEVARWLKTRGTSPERLFVSGRRAPRLVRDEGVHLLDDAGLVKHISQLSGTDARILDDPELMEMVLPPIRADYRAAETYRYTPGPPLDCPLSVLIGDADPQVNREEAAGWAEHTTGPHELKVFPGGHFYLTSQWSGVTELVRGRLSVR
mgnify:CR=1 FL=1